VAFGVLILALVSGGRIQSHGHMNRGSVLFFEHSVDLAHDSIGPLNSFYQGLDSQAPPLECFQKDLTGHAPSFYHSAVEVRLMFQLGAENI
jgi:hypothetical protein